MSALKRIGKVIGVLARIALGLGVYLAVAATLLWRLAKDTDADGPDADLTDYVQSDE